MFEDALLILRFKCGSGEALGRIYEKYRHYLLKLATALLYDVNAAEDVVQDVFVRFAQSGGRLGLRGSLKGYLRTSVIHGVRNRIRDSRTHGYVGLDEGGIDSKSPASDCWVILNEESARVNDALVRLPFEQREIVVLHLCGGMTFRDIAELQAESIKTIQSRYRYGMEKLRSLLDGEVEK
jgi:RNA polymerase sigma-70 factor (ECF subfamily)